MSGCEVINSHRAKADLVVRFSLVFLFAFLATNASASQNQAQDYTNYVVYRVGLKNDEQVNTLLEYANQKNLDVWRPPSVLPASSERNADIMVAPAKQKDFVNRMSSMGATTSIFIDDVQSKFQDEKLMQNSRSNLNTIADEKYFRYSEMMTLLNDLSVQYPNRVSLIPIGSSFEKRPMFVVYISKDHKGKRPAIFVDGGIHAREWISPSVVLQAIHRLISDPGAQDLLDVDWYFLPVVNPDGYEYSHTTDRMWRKTRSNKQQQQSNRRCVGVDANRNFGFFWNVAGASSDPCSETFAGPYAFSEPETRNLRDFLVMKKDKIKLYITYHSYGEYLLYPWGFTKNLPDNSDELDGLAQRVLKSMVKAGSPPYKIGSSTNVLYAAAGGSDDWAKGVANISLAYTIELPSYGYGFQLPPTYVGVVSNHTFVGLREFAKYVASRNPSKDSPSSATAPSGQHPSSNQDKNELRPVGARPPSRPILQVRPPLSISRPTSTVGLFSPFRPGPLRPYNQAASSQAPTVPASSVPNNQESGKVYYPENTGTQGFQSPNLNYGQPQNAPNYNAPSQAAPAPASVSQNAPASASQNAPSSASQNAPSSASQNAPASASQNAPASASQDAPSSASQNAPSHNLPSLASGYPVFANPNPYNQPYLFDHHGMVFTNNYNPYSQDFFNMVPNFQQGYFHDAAPLGVLYPNAGGSNSYYAAPGSVVFPDSNLNNNQQFQVPR